jgi:hypothetical protein
MSDFFRLYQKLTTDQIRKRIEEIAAEERALRAIYRAKMDLERQRQRERQRAEVGSER